MITAFPFSLSNFPLFAASMSSILYIDDDPDDHEFFREALKIVAPDVNCYFARDGATAIDLLYSVVLLPDHIFLDLNMPHMDGKQFLYTLKKSDFKDIPVSIFTTSTNPRDKNECEKLGATNFYTKPTTYTGIVEFLSQFRFSANSAR
jgi:CheY-like chemotaxis protein